MSIDTIILFVKHIGVTPNMPEEQLMFDVKLPSSGDGVHFGRTVPVYVAVPMVDTNDQGQTATQQEMVEQARNLIWGKLQEFYSAIEL